MKRLSPIVLFMPLLAACASRPAPRPESAAPRPEVTVPSPPPVMSPNSLTPLGTVPKAIAEPRIRVGLLSDQTTVSFPRIAGGYLVVTAGGASSLRRGFSVKAPLSDATLRYAVQAGAISDQPSADSFVEKLHAASGVRVDSVFDPAGGLYRILAGDFADSQSAQPLRDQLVKEGYGTGMMIVRRPSDQPFRKSHHLVDDEGNQYDLDGDSLLVLPASSQTVTIDGHLYRGGARLFINNRGLLNIINELNFEDYLRGVVPAEMGPKIFDELEALKAQALAARTYAVRNRGQFAVEGYDICPGPACQAYSGFSAEDPLSDRAVKETADMVITYDGKPIDALFTSTCGGETSDVGTMFPGRTDPYLKHARCVELEMRTIDGRGDSALLTEMQVNARVFASMTGLGDSAAWSATEVRDAVVAAAQLVGLKLDPTLRAASSRRGDVLNYFAAVAGLADAGRALTLPEDRRYFFPQTGSLTQAHEAAAFLIKYGLMPTQDLDRLDLNAAMPKDELYALLGAWLRKFEALQDATGKILSIDGRAVVLKADQKSSTFRLPPGIPIFRRLGDRYQEYRAVPIMIGDRAFVQLGRTGEVAGMIVQANFDGASFDRTSSFADWTRSYRAEELVASINKRNPIRQLLDLRPTVVDVANRIAELEVTAEGGRKFVLKGLPVRWSLNVPDNIFVIAKSVDADGTDRYTFFGKGWGHGIGLCQVGSYGMAFRGLTAEQIVKRYYTGVEITRVAPTPARP
jgi:stage II sporulation protein D